MESGLPRFVSTLVIRKKWDADDPHDLDSGLLAIGKVSGSQPLAMVDKMGIAKTIVSKVQSKLGWLRLLFFNIQVDLSCHCICLSLICFACCAADLTRTLVFAARSPAVLCSLLNSTCAQNVRGCRRIYNKCKCHVSQQPWLWVPLCRLSVFYRPSWAALANLVGPMFDCTSRRNLFFSKYVSAQIFVDMSEHMAAFCYWKCTYICQPVWSYWPLGLSTCQ